MRPVRRIIAGAILAVPLVHPGTGLTSAAEAKTLIYCSTTSPEGFDPALYTDPATLQASSRMLYDRLVEIAPDTTLVEPGLAERWAVSDDGLEYTFTLRPEVSFHANDDFVPTRDLDADDVVFSFMRQWDVDHPFFDVAGGTWPTFEGMAVSEVLRSIEKVDDRTVRFTLQRRDASFLQTLAMDFASILSKEYADKLLADGTPEMLDARPIGTGPFRLVAYDPETAVRYAASPDYWAGPPRVDKVMFDITPADEVRWRKFMAGVCQVAERPTSEDLASMAADEAVALIEQVGLDVGYLAYNTSKAPFDDPRVRRALNMAVDRGAIIEAVYGDGGTLATSPLPPTVWSHEDVVDDAPPDPRGARALLRDARASNLRVTLWAMPVARPYNPDGQRVVEMIREDWEAIGVRVEIVTDEWDSYLRRTAEVDHDGAVLFGWQGDNGDPDNFLAVLLGCDAVGIANRAEWCHEPFQNLILAAKAETDQAKRADLYRQAQAIFAKEAPWLLLGHSMVRVAAAPSVENVIVDPFGYVRFSAVDIAE